MPRKGFGLQDYSRGRVLPGIYAGQAAQDEQAAAPYRAALEKAAYADAGRNYGAGLNQITNFLASSGPMADSGGGTALKARLASSLYGAAAGRIGNSYADFLGSLMKQRQQYNYQMALMKQQKKMQQTGLGGVLGGIVGGVAGPALGAIGTNLGNRILPAGASNGKGYQYGNDYGSPYGPYPYAEPYYG